MPRSPDLAIHVDQSSIHYKCGRHYWKLRETSMCIGWGLDRLREMMDIIILHTQVKQAVGRQLESEGV